MPSLERPCNCREMHKGSIKQNIFWALLGNLIYAGSQWAILVVLTKFLDADAVGKFALGLAVAAPVFGFANLQLRALQATDIRELYLTKNYVGLRILSSAVALIFIAALIYTQGYGRDTSKIIFLVAIAKAIESISDIFYGILQKHEELKIIAWSLIQRGLLGLLFVGVAAATTGMVAAASLALAMAWLVILVSYDYRKVLSITNQNAPNTQIIATFKLSEAVRLARMAFPMGVLIGLNSLNPNIPRYFIASTHGEAAVGYYSAVAYVMVASALIVTAIGQAITPRMAKYYVEDRIAYKGLLARSLSGAALIGVLGVIVAFLYGREILRILYTEEYSQHYLVFVWTMVGAALFGCTSILGVAITAARSFNSQALMAVVMVILTYIACSILVPKLGLNGAAIAVVIALSFKMCGQLVQLFYLLRTSIKGDR